MLKQLLGNYKGKFPAVHFDKIIRSKMYRFISFVNLLMFCSYQMLYADSYMTRDEFHQMFDHTLYNKMRKTLNCEEAFPEIYDKVSRSARI